MPSPENPQTWVPYELTKDCSLGLCSIYCTQWCYIYLPPPPPAFAVDGDNSSTSTLSPLVIVIVSVIAISILLVGYYTIISKYCSFCYWFHRDRHNHLAFRNSHWREEWHNVLCNGLDESVISKITVFEYKSNDGFMGSTECSVCLCEFRDDERLRLLPNCSHAFHIQCIDTWMKSHSSCPLCRANIVPVNSGPSTMIQIASVATYEGNTDSTVVAVDDGAECSEKMDVVMRDLSDSLRREKQLNNKVESSIVVDIGADNDDNNVQNIRRSLSLDSLRWGKVSVAEVMQISMEDELKTAKVNRTLVGTSSSGRFSREQSRSGSKSNGLHGVISPVTMKRSTSNNGRLCLTKHGKGKNAILLV